MPHIPCISSAATSRAMFASEEAAAVNNVKGLYERLKIFESCSCSGDFGTALTLLRNKDCLNTFINRLGEKRGYQRSLDEAADCIEDKTDRRMFLAAVRAFMQTGWAESRGKTLDKAVFLKERVNKWLLTTRSDPALAKIVVRGDGYCALRACFAQKYNNPSYANSSGNEMRSHIRKEDGFFKKIIKKALDASCRAAPLPNVFGSLTRDEQEKLCYEALLAGDYWSGVRLRDRVYDQLAARATLTTGHLCRSGHEVVPASEKSNLDAYNLISDILTAFLADALTKDAQEGLGLVKWSNNFGRDLHYDLEVTDFEGLKRRGYVLIPATAADKGFY